MRFTSSHTDPQVASLTPVRVSRGLHCCRSTCRGMLAPCLRTLPRRTLPEDRLRLYLYDCSEGHQDGTGPHDRLSDVTQSNLMAAVEALLSSAGHLLRLQFACSQQPCQLVHGIPCAVLRRVPNQRLPDPAHSRRTGRNV